MFIDRGAGNLMTFLAGHSAHLKRVHTFAEDGVDGQQKLMRRLRQHGVGNANVAAQPFLQADFTDAKYRDAKVIVCCPPNTSGSITDEFQYLCDEGGTLTIFCH